MSKPDGCTCIYAGRDDCYDSRVPLVCDDIFREIERAERRDFGETCDCDCHRPLERHEDDEEMDEPQQAAQVGHRWSGWPGAWCLDCGQEDPAEQCLAAGPHLGSLLDGGPNVCPEHPPTQCSEQGSRRHDPYAQKMEAHRETRAC